jgi:hypothetical protein
MVSSAHLIVLRKLDARLAETDINWALTGSTSFALQGVPVEPNDIDIQTDANGAYAIEQLFPEFITRKVAFSATDRIRSHFGALEIDGLKVEIMGDIEKRLDDDTWQAPPDLNQHRQFVDVAGMRIPVLSLEYETEAYRIMGRIERAAMLRVFLDTRD